MLSRDLAFIAPVLLLTLALLLAIFLRRPSRRIIIEELAGGRDVKWAPLLALCVSSIPWGGLAIFGLGIFSVVRPDVLDLGILRKATVEITSDPAGSVSVDGVLLGQAPLSVKLHEGRHRVKVDGVDGYVPVDTTVVVRAGQPVLTRLVRAAIKRTKVDQSPAIVRDRPAESAAVVTSLGTGYELDVLRVDGGWYEVRLQNGVEGWIRRAVTEDMTFLTWFYSAPPSGATIHIDGTYQGTTPKALGLKPGRHELRVGGVSGYQDATRSFTVSADGGSVSVTLEPTASEGTSVQSERAPDRVPASGAASVRIRINSTPESAWVSIGGNRVGRTPLDLDLKPGKITVDVSKDGYEPVVGQKITVSADTVRYHLFELRAPGRHVFKEGRRNFTVERVHDLEQVWPAGTALRIQWETGTPGGHCSGGTVAFSTSTDQREWRAIGTASYPERRGRGDVVHTSMYRPPNPFRFVRVSIPNNYCDYSSAEVNWK